VVLGYSFCLQKQSQSQRLLLLQPAGSSKFKFTALFTAMALQQSSHTQLGLMLAMRIAVQQLLVLQSQHMLSGAVACAVLTSLPSSQPISESLTAAASASTRCLM
jgi:hypothetical protein